MERACPNCGARPLYVPASRSERAAEAAGRSPEDRSSEAARTATTVPSSAPSPPSNPEPPPMEVTRASGRSARSAVAFVLVSIVLTVGLGTWLKAHGGRPAPASSDVALLETPAGNGSPTTSATPRPSQTSEGVGPIELAHIGRRSVTVGSVPMSFRVPADRLGSVRRPLDQQERVRAAKRRGHHLLDEHRRPRPYVKSVRTVVGFPGGQRGRLRRGSGGSRPEPDWSRGPSDVSIGGFPAQHLVFTVRKDPPCEPGFFYRWHATRRGAFWSTTDVGDTINVWIVDVDGTRIFIESEITMAHDGAGPELEQEIRRIVGSIRFN